MVEVYLVKDEKLYAAFMDREIHWNVLKIYDVGGQLSAGVKAFHRETSACVRVDGEVSKSFPILVGLGQGCLMSPWLFYYFCRWIYERNESSSVECRCKIKNLWKWVGSGGILLCREWRGTKESGGWICIVCIGRKLKVKARKSKVMVFERKEEELLISIHLIEWVCQQ